MDNSVYSTTITEVLKRIGLCSDEIDWRRKMWTLCGKLLNIRMTLSKRCRAYVTGSRVEGGGLGILGSDLDVMSCDNSVRVIHDSSDWELNPRVLTLVTDVSTVHPGYCLLKLMGKYVPLFYSNSDSSVTTRYNGAIVLNHNFFSTPDFHTSHGPAMTPCRNGLSMDIVACFHTSWPPKAKEWIERNRRSNFPPSDFIYSAEERGAFIVPVGYNADIHPAIEWRFSFSLLELEIIHMWPITAIRCYVALKLLKTYITNQSRLLVNTLSTYHMKTLMFWLLEETGIEYWLAHSFMDCPILSLTRLLDWIALGYIPQYFLPENNLLDAWKNKPQQKLLAGIISNLVSDNYYIYRAFVSVMEEQQIDTSVTNARSERASIRLDLHGLVIQLSWLFGYRIKYCESICELVQTNKELIHKLSEVDVCYDQELKLVVESIKDGLKSICATHILSKLEKTRASNHTRFILYRIMGKLFSGHLCYRTVALRKANFFYQAGKYQRAIDILQIVSDTTNHTTIKHSLSPGNVKLSTEQINSIVSARNTFPGIILTEEAFFREEIKALPNVLQYEMFRTSNTPRNFDQWILYDLLDLLLIDPDVLLYYIQYLCFTQFGRSKHAEIAFNNLKWVVNGTDVLQRGTALNVLGHCYMAQGNIRAAVNCFVKALRVDSQFTVSSLVHIAIAIKKWLKQNWNRIFHSSHINQIFS